jgi:large subunit ribosomal protein L9
MKLIELLLTDNVDNLGIVGDVVKVRPGYARNFLLPRGLAAKPTPGAIQRLAARRAEVEKEMAARRATLEAMLEKLSGHEITTQRSANEQGVLFGGVSQHDVGELLRAEGFSVEDRMIRLGQQIKRLDSYTIPVVLAADLKTEVKLWVVSDKPQDQLATREEARAEEQPDEGQAGAPKAKAEGEAKLKKPKKAREPKEGEAAAAPAADGAEAKPEAKEAKPKKPKKEKKAEGEAKEGEKKE